MSKYFSLGYLAFRERVRSPIALAVIQFNMLLRVWILCQLYQASFATKGSSQIAGLEFATTLWSLMLVQAAMLSRWPSLARTITLDIRDGGFVVALQRPYSYVLAMAMQAFGRLLPVLILNLITGSCVAFVLVGAPAVSASAGLWALLVLVFGLVLDLTLLLCLGLCALWLDASESLEWIYDKFFVVFGGAFLPLAFLPLWLQPFVGFLPFGLLYYSASLVFLQAGESAPLQIIAQQLVWLLLIGALATLLFHRGVRHVAHNGG